MKVKEEEECLCVGGGEGGDGEERREVLFDGKWNDGCPTAIGR